MPFRDAILAAAPDLAPAERQVAQAVVDDPERVAFGTVADLARRSGTSGPTVVRVARKLGFDGYRALQAAARADLSATLAPAAERIRHTAGVHDDPISRTRSVELANVRATLDAADGQAFASAVRLLADRRRRVLVIAGDAERGIATSAADHLGQLREGVELVGGTPPRVAARVALVSPADVVLAIDVRRYDTWVLDAVAALRRAGNPVVAVTDGPLSPLATDAAAWFTVTAEGSGPFDSHVGTLALLHALLAGVADRLRGTAADRLDRIEAAWSDAGVLDAGAPKRRTSTPRQAR
jgi:DNA-binding MurR/RpiR family transcriptional regulator